MSSSFTGMSLSKRQAAIRASLSDEVTYYVALLTALGTAEDGSDVTEAAGSGYARAVAEGWTPGSVSVGAPFSSLATLANTSAVEFAALTGALGPIVGWALYDAAAEGTCLAVGYVLDGEGNPTTASYISGNSPTFFPGSLFVGIAGLLQ
jgi:hypothetical protein